MATITIKPIIKKGVKVTYPRTNDARTIDAVARRHQTFTKNVWGDAFEAAGVNPSGLNTGEKARAAIADFGNYGKVRPLADKSTPDDGDRSEGLIPYVAEGGFFYPYAGEQQNGQINLVAPLDVATYDADGGTWIEQGWQNDGSTITVPEGDLWDVPAGEVVAVRFNTAPAICDSDDKRIFIGAKVAQDSRIQAGGGYIAITYQAQVVEGPPGPSTVKSDTVILTSQDSGGTAWDVSVAGTGGLAPIPPSGTEEQTDTITSVSSPSYYQNTIDGGQRSTGHQTVDSGEPRLLGFADSFVSIEVVGPVKVQWSNVVVGIVSATKNP